MEYKRDLIDCLTLASFLDPAFQGGIDSLTRGAQYSAIEDTDQPSAWSRITASLRSAGSAIISQARFPAGSPKGRSGGATHMWSAPTRAYIAESSASLQCVLAGCACIWAPCSPDTMTVSHAATRFCTSRAGTGGVRQSKRVTFCLNTKI